MNTLLSLISYELYLLLSIFVMIYAYKTDKDQFTLKYDSIAKFVGFMAIVSMARLCLMDEQDGNLNVYGIQMSRFLYVFLEDAFFVMIPYYLCQKIQKKYINVIIWIGFSSLFAYGHVYQGYIVAAIIGVYPYFISRKYALKTSFSTVMACHFLYDTMTFCTVKIAKLFMYV